MMIQLQKDSTRSLSTTDTATFSSTSSFHSTTVVPKISLLKLAKQKKFTEIERVLAEHSNGEGGYSPDIQAWISGSGTLEMFRGETTLHSLMATNPSGQFVDFIIRHLRWINPYVVPEETVDINGRTPLHIACILCCDVSVVRRLLDGESAAMPAFHKDSAERYPLHWACLNASRRVDAQRWTRRKTAFSTKKNNMSKVIAALVDANPMGAAVKDGFGFTPLDLAKKSNASKPVINLLTEMVRKHCPSEVAAEMKIASNSEDTISSSSSSSMKKEMDEDDEEHDPGEASIICTKPHDSSSLASAARNAAAAANADDVSSVGTGGVSALIVTMHCRFERHFTDTGLGALTDL